MNRVKWFVVVLGLVACGAVCDAQMRVWTSTKGDSIEAEFVSIMGDKVVLKTTEGKILKVPKRGLCAKDLELLASLIPPSLKIEVDVDKKTVKLSDYEYYVSKRDTISCSVVITKTNREKCNRDFKACVYLFGEDVQGDAKMVMVKKEHKFNFKKSKQTSFDSGSASSAYREGYGLNKRGVQYHGYLVIVEDTDGKLIAVETNQTLYEKNVGNIKKFNAGEGFDRSFKKTPVNSSGGEYYF